MVGFWATVSLNIPDFTRYAKSQDAQIVGQALGLPAAMTLYSFIGVAVTSASAVDLRRADLGPGCAARPISSAAGRDLLALVALLIATLNTNVGRECRFAVQRFLQPDAATHLLPHRRSHHRVSSASP